MTTKYSALETRFRNLLIALARGVEELEFKVKDLEEAAIKQQHPGRRSAIGLLITERRKQQSRLLYLLSRNAEASRYFFGTVNTQAISCEQILFAEPL